MKSIYFILLGLIMASTISSCVRERDTDTSYSSDQVNGEFFYSNALDIADDASTKQTGDFLTNYKSYCTTLTHDNMSMPRTITIDFGTTNCLCADGRNRRGKILVSYTGNTYADSLGTIALSFENYFVDEYQVLGNLSVMNYGKNINSLPYQTLITTGKYMKPQVLDTILWNANRTRTQTQGSSTTYYEDDVFEYIGTGNGLNEYKIYYATNITKALVKSNSCKYFTQGIIELQPQGHALRTTNYGDGTCDNDAMVIFNTKAYNIKLK